jgi:hypothetical protein
MDGYDIRIMTPLYTLNEMGSENYKANFPVVLHILKT